MLDFPQLDVDRDKKIGLQIMQFICLLTVCTKENRLSLLSLLGEKFATNIPEISAIKISNTVIVSTLKEALIQAIHDNPNTLKKLTLDSIYLYNKDMHSLQSALSNKSNLATLNLSRNPLPESAAEMVASLITTNHGIKTLKFSDCVAGEEGAIKIANALNRSQVSTLVLQHRGMWENQTPIRNRGVNIFAQLLSDPQSPLRHLDLSFNQVNAPGIKKITQSLHTKSALKSLKLNDCDLGDQAMMSIISMLENNPSLESLELNGHLAKPATVGSLADAFKKNTGLILLSATPISMSRPDLARSEKPNPCRKKSRNINDILLVLNGLVRSKGIASG